MKPDLKRQKRYAAALLARYAAQSRDTVCDPIPPRSEVAVLDDNPGPYTYLLDQRLRVGYYRRQDGLNVIWIVYPNAEYGETTDHDHLRRYFRIVHNSGETDLYGISRPVLDSLIP